jgi:hypothetical protein
MQYFAPLCIAYTIQKLANPNVSQQHGSGFGAALTVLRI